MHKQIGSNSWLVRVGFIKGHYINFKNHTVACATMP